MENSWIEEFYGETDADKRLELLENNSTDMDGDSAGLYTAFRQRLWTARYGKRKPKNDAFVGCLMELKYISEGGSVDIGGQKKKQAVEIISKLCLFDADRRSAEEQEILLDNCTAGLRYVLHMDKEFAILQSAALAAFRQEYPNREHFLRK